MGEHGGCHFLDWGGATEGATTGAPETVRAADGAAAGTRDESGRPTDRGGRDAGRVRVAGYDVGSWNMPHFSSWLFASTSERKSPAPQSFSSP